MKNERSVHYRGEGHNFTWCGRYRDNHPDDRITTYNPLATCKKCLGPIPAGTYITEGMRLEETK